MDWLKLYTSKWLHGSGRMMTAEKRGIWMDLLALAAETKFRDGSLRFDVDLPMPLSYIAGTLMLSMEELESAIACFKADMNIDDGKARLEVWEDGTIMLNNFERYQATPDGKGKLSGRELELAQRMQLSRLSEKFPVEAANSPSVRKLLEGEQNDKATT